MFTWLSTKIAVGIEAEVSEKLKHLESMQSDLKRMQAKLDGEHYTVITGTANLQEEVFLLRDELAAFADYSGLVLVRDGDEVKAMPSEEQQENRRQILERMNKKRDELYIEQAARALVIALTAAEQRKIRRA